METLTGRDREHKQFSPSRSETFFKCPGSVNLLARLPAREQSIYADEGTIAHEVLEAGLSNRCINATQAIEASIHCCEDFDVEFKGSINDALDYVWQLMEDVNKEFGDAILYVERFVNPPVAAAPGEAAGYCDIAVYSAKARRLWVIDYKHGKGIAKAALGNTQVKQYAAGFLFEDNAVVNAAYIDLVTMVIIQPRAFHPDGEIREYDTTPAVLFDYIMELDEAIELCQDPSAPLIPGDEQCRFCDARSSCPAIQALVVNAVNPAWSRIEDVKQVQLPDIKSLDINRLSYALQMSDIISIWINGVKGHADELLRSGIPIPGFKLVEVHPKRKWYGDDEEDIAKRLAATIGCPVDEVWTRKLITITDAEKLIKESFKKRVARNRRKQAAEEATQTFAYFTLKQSSGTTTMVPNDDPRPAADKVAQAYSGIAGLISPPNPNGATQ